MTASYNPTATPPPVLIFRSKSGRTEIARQPDGTLSIHVLTGKDRLDASDVDWLTHSLVGTDNAEDAADCNTDCTCRHCRPTAGEVSR